MGRQKKSAANTKQETGVDRRSKGGPFLRFGRYIQGPQTFYL